MNYLHYVESHIYPFFSSVNVLAQFSFSSLCFKLTFDWLIWLMTKQTPTHPHTQTHSVRQTCRLLLLPLRRGDIRSYFSPAATVSNVTLAKRRQCATNFTTESPTRIRAEHNVKLCELWWTLLGNYITWKTRARSCLEKGVLTPVCVSQQSTRQSKHMLLLFFFL